MSSKPAGIKQSNLRDTVKYSRGKDYHALRKDGASITKKFYENRITDKHQIIAIEEPFSIEIEGLPYPFIGVIDLIEMDNFGGLIITDYKTASKSYTKAQTDENKQLSIVSNSYAAKWVFRNRHNAEI